jgi:predicted MarR family transcription regulator
MYKFNKKEKTEQEIIRLLAECGMISTDEAYSHQQMRCIVAAYIHNMSPCAKQAILNTITFLLYREAGE